MEEESKLLKFSQYLSIVILRNVNQSRKLKKTGSCFYLDYLRIKKICKNSDGTEGSNHFEENLQ